MTVRTVARPEPVRPVAVEVAEPKTVRVPPSRWEAASVLAKAEGLDISKVVNHYLQHYIDTAEG